MTNVPKMSGVFSVLLEVSAGCDSHSVSGALFMGLEHGALLIYEHLVELRSDAVRTACYSEIFGRRSDNPLQPAVPRIIRE